MCRDSVFNWCKEYENKCVTVVNFSHKRAINLCQSQLRKERPRSKHTCCRRCAICCYICFCYFSFVGMKKLKKGLISTSLQMHLQLSACMCVRGGLSLPWAAKREAINTAHIGFYVCFMIDYLFIRPSIHSSSCLPLTLCFTPLGMQQRGYKTINIHHISTQMVQSKTFIQCSL